MHEKGYKYGNLVPSILIVLLSDLVMIFAGCRNKIGETEKDIIERNKSEINIVEVNPAFVRFSSFQNNDSTWGYTVFVNSRPYLRQSRIPFKKSNSGFKSREDAEIVGRLVVKMIKNGDLTPKLDRKLIDSLEVEMMLKEKTGK